MGLGCVKPMGLGCVKTQRRCDGVEWAFYQMSFLVVETSRKGRNGVDHVAYHQGDLLTRAAVSQPIGGNSGGADFRSVNVALRRLKSASQR